MSTTHHLIKGAMVALMILAAGCTSTPLNTSNAKNNEYLVYVDGDDVILQGYDPVAFFTEGRAVQGSSEHTSLYHDAVYHFTSAANKERFDADPEHYKPQFGGHCAMSMAMGKLEPADATTGSIVDGRLVVQRNAKAKNMWSKDPQGHLRKADGNWPRLVHEHGKRG